MESQGDLIEEAIAAGRLTKCPPRVAAGHKRARKKGRVRKKRKGEKIRPCVRCEAPVKFISGTWAAYGQRRRGWHWVNHDGTHHRCSDFRAVREDTWNMQWRAAMERDSFRTEQGAKQGTGNGLDVSP